MADSATPGAHPYGWLRRLVPIALAVIGLIFAGTGVFMLTTQNWEQATGTVQLCVPRTVTTGSTHRTQVSCTVTWTAQGVGHTAEIDVAERNLHPGQSLALRVNGGSAREDSPAWLGPAVGGFGAALVVTSIVVLVRQRRKAA